MQHNAICKNVNNFELNLSSKNKNRMSVSKQVHGVKKRQWDVRTATAITHAISKIYTGTDREN